jgi:hypothetical protein
MWEFIGGLLLGAAMTAIVWGAAFLAELANRALN